MSTGSSGSGGMLNFSAESFKKWLLIIFALFLIWQARAIFSLDESEILADEELDSKSRSSYTAQQGRSPADSILPDLAQDSKSIETHREETSSGENSDTSSLGSTGQSENDELASSISSDEEKPESEVGCNLVCDRYFLCM